MILPDDVAIRTSDHHGGELRVLHDLWSALVEASGGKKDGLFEVLLDGADDFHGATFNALCGFYRLSFVSLRSVVELITIGTFAQISGRLAELKKWRNGHLIIPFDAACAAINGSRRLSVIKDYLYSELADSLFDSKRGPQESGWARRLYSTLSNYSHARPGYADSDIRQSNGPIYVPGAFVQAVKMHLEVAAFTFIMIKLARQEFVLPDGGRAIFQPGHPAIPEIARACWRKLA